MAKDISLYIDDIRESISLIRKYSKDLTLSELTRDQGKQDQIIRRLLVIGEAVAHIPEKMRQLVPDIDWKKIKGMRDILVHDYDSIIPEEIMFVLTNNLDQLEKGIEELEKKLKSGL